MDIMVWVRQICGFLILSSILKYLLPQKHYSAYVKLFLNLLLVLLLSGPLMQIDVSRMSGVWQEAAAEVNGSGWRQQLADMARQEQTGEQLGRILERQLDTILIRKGYRLADVELKSDELTGTVSTIELTVEEDPDYITSPVIWKEGDTWKADGEEEKLKKYLEEELGLAADVLLTVTIKR